MRNLKVNELMCDVTKRRICDSFYKKRYDRLLKSYNILLKEINTTKAKLEAYKIIVDNINIVKGGVKDGKGRYEITK